MRSLHSFFVTNICNKYPELHSVTSWLKYGALIIIIRTLRTEIAFFWPVSPTGFQHTRFAHEPCTKPVKGPATQRGLPQRTAVCVRCGMLQSKQTLLTIIFW